MCGIAGFISGDKLWYESRLNSVVSAMTDTLAHRGPDASGVWTDYEDHIALGHRRLSVIDLSDRGSQPMISSSGRYILTYNGEIYNYKDIRAELANDGVKFKGDCDTEVLLEAIEKWGLRGAIDKFNGMFAFALWDSKDKRMFLARDRLGEKPLYYTFMDGVFMFASELKAFFKHPVFKPNININSVALFMKYCYIPAPYTIYSGVFKLPPASILEARLSDLSRTKITKYWSIDNKIRGEISESFGEAVEKLDKLLRDSVSIRLNSDVPLGVFLSGGVDSSLVAAIAEDVGTGDINTFTIGFDDKGFDESKYAELVSESIGTKHTTIKVGYNDIIEALNSLPHIYDEPFADSSQLLEIVVSRKSRKFVTVALTGDGGDESFIGYDRYLWLDRIVGMKKKLMKLLLSVVPMGILISLIKILGKLNQRLFFTDLDGKVHRLKHLVDIDNPIQMYDWLNSYWRDTSLIVPRSNIINSEIPKTDSLITSIALNDTLLGLPDDMLVKVDRATMSVGLEARAPLLDHRVVEFAWGIPLGFKLRNGVTKAVLRSVLAKYVPESLTDRPKAGFGAPISSWLRDSLKPWAESILDWNRIESDGILNVESIKEKWYEHLSGAKDNHKELWTVLIFQQWLNANRDKIEGYT